MQNELTEHALNIFKEYLYKDKQKFSLFYLNWIGAEHVITVLEDSLKHGDMNQYILDSCSSKEDVEKFINSKIY
jgi:hypothetical protein